MTTINNKTYKNVREFVDTADLDELSLVWMKQDMEEYSSIIANRFAREGAYQQLRAMLKFDVDHEELAYNAGKSGDWKTINLAIFHYIDVEAEANVKHQDEYYVARPKDWISFMEAYHFFVVKGAIEAGHTDVWVKVFTSVSDPDLHAVGYGAAVTDNVDLMKIVCENNYDSDIGRKIKPFVKWNSTELDCFVGPALEHKSEKVIAYLQETFGPFVDNKKGEAMLMNNDLAGVELLDDRDHSSLLSFVARSGSYDATKALLEKGVEVEDKDKDPLVKKLMKEGYADVAALFK